MQLKRFALGALLTCAAVTGAQARESDNNTPDAVMTRLIADFNAAVLRFAKAEDGLFTLKGLRTATMMHIAMHDALNSADQRYERYTDSTQADIDDPYAAATSAAYTIVLKQYPQQRDTWAQLRGRIRGADTRNKNTEFGQRLAESLFEGRDGDGWNSEAEYRFHPMGPGVYAEFAEHSGTPQGFVFGTGWARARPFGLESASQFRSPPPPAIDSREYARAFEEVKALGRHASTARTADETHLAMWWKDFVENSHNRLARKLVVEDQLDPWRAARMFALLNMAIYDGYLASFENKFHYNHWRPYTAIRWAEHDGNALTQADESWDNLHHHTYAFPSYPSAHGTVCGAAMTVLADSFGAMREFTMETREVDSSGPGSPPMATQPPVRHFRSFDEAARECAMSRVYLGIHFRYDSEFGHDLGTQVADFLLRRKLIPLRH
ncbi:MAG: vanadium-dependent haloperoxidase [Steroidobacteraceae bacterium]